jgi:uncharacterized protein (TIGR02271 family)
MTNPALHPRQTVREGSSADHTLGVHEEHLVVERRVVQGQTVRVATTTQLHEHQVEEPLTGETIEVERVPVGRAVEATPDIRHEGDVTIIPVMEEVLFIERRLILKEEIRIKRVQTTKLHRETVQLRDQEVSITRFDGGRAVGDDLTPESTPESLQPEPEKEIP